MLLRRIGGMPEPPEDEKADNNGREAQEREGEQESLETAARSFLRMPLMFGWIGIHGQRSLSAEKRPASQHGLSLSLFRPVSL